MRQVDKRRADYYRFHGQRLARTPAIMTSSIPTIWVRRRSSASIMGYERAGGLSRGGKKMKTAGREFPFRLFSCPASGKLELTGVELIISAFLREQLTVGAAFDDTALFQHHDAV